MLDALDAAAVRRWCTAGLEALRSARGEIDHLNVYPVADRDTGTNLVLTMQSVADSLEAQDGPVDLAGTVMAMSQGALTGARGNSGVILAGFLRGFSESLRANAGGGGAVLIDALERAADLGYAAVALPVEGTVLSVARAAAQAARASGCADLPTVARAAARGAHEALARTPFQLSELARAGVVDAGGLGLCILLDVLVSVVTGEPAAPGETGSHAGDPGDDSDSDGLTGAPAPAGYRYAYEVQYLLDAGADSVSRLQQELGELGDSVAVVGAEGVWNVHAHVNDAGAAIEAGVHAGHPYRITVTPFSEPAGTPTGGRSVVAVAPVGPLASLFESAGASVVPGSRHRPPTVGEVVAVIKQTGAGQLALLPNSATAVEVVEQATKLAGRDGIAATVIPTRSLVQGLAALAVHDPACSFAEDVGVMAAAAAATRWAEVRVAHSAELTSAGICQPGDVLGVLDGDVALIGVDSAVVSAELVDRMLANGGEMVTVVTGADSGALGTSLARHVTVAHGAAETVVYAGGQADNLLMIGVE